MQRDVMWKTKLGKKLGVGILFKSAAPKISLSLFSLVMAGERKK